MFGGVGGQRKSGTRSSEYWHSSVLGPNLVQAPHNHQNKNNNTRKDVLI